MNRSLCLGLILCFLGFVGCTPEDAPVSEDSGTTEPAKKLIEPTLYPGIEWNEGMKYVWDENYIPEITINITLEQWNALLAEFDANSATESYVHCDVCFKKGNEVTELKDAGLRLRGNTSRRRPEGKKGLIHVKDGADWQKFHFALNFRKFNKDNEHELQGLHKLHLKYFHEDYTYVKEVFCFDLFQRAGIWTGLWDGYCRIWFHVEGDTKPAYYGIYNLMEQVDEQYLKHRKANFGSAKGNLWKCNVGADLTDNTINKMGPDSDEVDYIYELKETGGNYNDAEVQLKRFIRNVCDLNDEDFYEWIRKVCDLDLLLRTYAVNVALGGWDDFWNNANNFYIYFNSTDYNDYKFFFIPYDYDNTLGTSQNCGVQIDAVRHNPYNWGNRGLLMTRLMKIDECKEIYRDELKRIVADGNSLMDYETATARIKKWQNSISKYISNDTGEDMSIIDKPASWGSQPNYRVMDPNPNVNFFKVKTQTINALK